MHTLLRWGIPSLYVDLAHHQHNLLGRQALHAFLLAFIHPESGERIEFQQRILMIFP